MGRLVTASDTQHLTPQSQESETSHKSAMQQFPKNIVFRLPQIGPLHMRHWHYGTAKQQAELPRQLSRAPLPRRSTLQRGGTAAALAPGEGSSNHLSKAAARAMDPGASSQPARQAPANGSGMGNGLFILLLLNFSLFGASLVNPAWTAHLILYHSRPVW